MSIERDSKAERKKEREKLRELQLTRNLAHVPGDSAVNHPGSYSALRTYVTFIPDHTFPPTYHYADGPFRRPFLALSYSIRNDASLGQHS